MRVHSWIRYLGLTSAYGLLFLGFFYLAGFFGLLGGSLWYPAAGLRMAMLLIFGWRWVLGVVLAEIIAIAIYEQLNIAIGFISPWIVLRIAPTPVIYGLATFALTRYAGLDVRLRRVRDVAWLVVAAVSVPLVAAVRGSLVEITSGTVSPEAFIPSMMAFWSGDAIGILMLTPLLLVWHDHRSGKAAHSTDALAAIGGSGPLNKAHLLFDFAAIWATLLVLNRLPDWFDELGHHVHWYLAFIPIIWISFRHGLIGSITGTLAITSGAAWLVYLPIESIRFHELQMLVLTVGATGLLMGSVVSTLKRQNQELQLTQGELEASNRELERFVYTVSHDLKSPLITVRGFLGLLKKDLKACDAGPIGDDSRIQSNIERIDAATGKMGRLLDELLELSRVGRALSAPETVQLAELAREEAGQVAGRINARGVEVVIAPDLPTVLGNRRQLFQVLQNLIDNAVKYIGDQPQPRVEVGCRRDAEETVCYVRDNGIGIDARFHDKVFGLFERLDRDQEGTGVGLALVKRIIEEHGGRIWVESEGAGHGTTFCFTLGRQRSTPEGET